MAYEKKGVASSRAPAASAVTLTGAGSLCPVPHHAQTHISSAPPIRET